MTVSKCDKHGTVFIIFCEKSKQLWAFEKLYHLERYDMDNFGYAMAGKFKFFMKIYEVL